jgi:hypothetical protein
MLEQSTGTSELRVISLMNRAAGKPENPCTLPLVSAAGGTRLSVTRSVLQEVIDLLVAYLTVQETTDPQLIIIYVAALSGACDSIDDCESSG